MSSKKSRVGLFGLSFGAVGVVFGDIGTSPLYAINQIFFGRFRVEPTPQHVTSLISLVIWVLLLIITFKYVALVLRADNEGEGGVFSLFALLKKLKGKSVVALSTVLVIAAGLLFGEGIITPAISVLSAVEGIQVAAPALHTIVLPLTIVILTVLFAAQRQGTHKVGRLFGPVITVWFLAIAALGIMQIIHAPAILQAFNPVNALHGLTMFPFYDLLVILGSVVLVVTGGEALYADMGHFGKTPIRLSWFGMVLPCLILNYLGQGAYLLRGQAVHGGSLFYSLVPQALLIPMVILASMATVIASQALISGAFSLASQGIALGLIPRLRIKHTHEHHAGQIYVSFINWAIYGGCILLVLTFRSSERLASAYGLAVSGVMMTTTFSMMIIARQLWRWPRLVVAAIFVPLAAIDMLFLTANGLKFLEGGFVPLTIALVLYLAMNTWSWGKRHWRQTLSLHTSYTMGDIKHLKSSQSTSLDRSLLILSPSYPTSLEDKAPALLELFLNRYHLLPKHLIVLTVSQTQEPHVTAEERYEIHQFDNDHDKDTSLLAINARFGFLETPNVETVIHDIASNNELTPDDDMKDWIIYVARERVFFRGHNRLLRLRAAIYSILVNNATPAYEYYGLGADSRLSAELVPIRFK
jgi:KUP system potassium uptake protein